VLAFVIVVIGDLTLMWLRTLGLVPIAPHPQMSLMRAVLTQLLTRPVDCSRARPGEKEVPS